MNPNTTSLPSLWGSLMFDTTFSLEELGNIISEVMFSNLPFQGRDQNIYDEVPAIFIKDHPLGLKVVLSGNSQSGYRLEVQSYFRIKETPNERVYLDGYLFELFKNYLELSSEDIGLIATKRYGEKRYPEH